MSDEKASPDSARERYLADIAARRRVHVLPTVFTPQQCAALRKTCTKVASEYGWQTDRHAAYSTTDLPAIALPAKALRFVERVITRSALNFFATTHGFERADLYPKDLFFVRYFGGDEGSPPAQTHLDMHSDGCLFSFNITLSPDSAFDGGGTEFAHVGPAGALVERAADGTCGARSGARDDMACGAIVRAREGDLVMHDGAVRHAGRAITRGERLLLVGFCEAVRSPLARVARERASGVSAADAVLALQIAALDARLRAQAQRRASGGAESQVLEDAMVLLRHGDLTTTESDDDDGSGRCGTVSNALARVADHTQEVIWADDWESRMR